MKKFSRQIVMAATLSLLAGAGMAQTLKFGFVNTERIFREATPALAAQAKLEQEFSKREAELNAQGASLKSSSEKFEREAPTLAESQRLQRQRQLAEQDRDLQRRSREFQEDLNTRRNEELQQVLERANRVIKQVAESESYDLILQDAVYVNPKNDITDKVLKALNGK
jgi:outer membrane protein